jgi:peptide/nickel transport system substrate-binding protein
MTPPVMLGAYCSRRGLLAGGLSVVAAPILSGLLAACGGDDDDEIPPAQATMTVGSIPTVSVGATPTPRSSATGATPAATGAAATATQQPVPTAAGDAPRRGGTLVLQGHQEISSLHPDDAGPTVHWVVVANIHDPLVEIDKDYQIAPVLASALEIAPDGLSYTFNLHEDVLFHDGEPFGAADVVYTFEFYMDPANATLNSNLFTEVAGVEAPDPLTVVVRMSGVNAAFLALTAPTLVLPKHYHAAVGKEAYSSQPIGTGPFKLKEWKPAEQTTLEAFDAYFRGRPNIDFFREEVVPEPSVRAIALETGASDHAVWPLVVEDHLRLMDDDRFLVLRSPSTGLTQMPLNHNHPALGDKAVRQAMMHALDRDRLVTDLEKGLAVKATSNLSPALQFYYEPDVKQYPVDLDQSRALLDEAGWLPGSDGVREKEGVRLSFTVTTISGDQRRRPYAEVFQQDLKAVGIEMKIEENPVSSLLEAVVAGTFHATIWNSGVGGDNGEPDARAAIRSDARGNTYHNPEMDRLLDTGVATTDPAERRKIYSDVQKLIAEDVPFIYIMFWEWIELWSKRVRGVPESSPNTNAPYTLIYTYWLDDDRA